MTEPAEVRFTELDGRRSSQAAGKAVFAAAAIPADPALAARIASERDWRKRYLEPVRRLVEAGAASRSSAIQIARAGLAAVHERVELGRGGEGVSLFDAVRSPGAATLRSETISGSGRSGRPELAIPYRGEVLRGDAIRRRLDRWVEAGVVEPSCREAVEKVLANPDWLDLSDRRFVVLGAASQMGALEALCAWGADVAAVDLRRPALWERVLRTAREGTGRLRVPVRAEAPGGNLAEVGGADLLRDTLAVAAWLDEVEPPFTVVDDTYADGAAFVLLAATTDALMASLASRPGVSLAYLATPTDVFAVPEEVALSARTRSARPRGRTLRAATRGALYRPSYEDLVNGEDGRRWGIVDCLVPQQGANYALAKTLQRWRAVVARDDGVPVSSNVAPATRTTSVTKNRALAAAYRGASAYGIEIFEPETSRWLMAALLVHDLRNDGGAGAGHPFDLFTESAAHGGIWRMPYEPRSVLPLAVVRGLVRR